MVLFDALVTGAVSGAVFSVLCSIRPAADPDTPLGVYLAIGMLSSVSVVTFAPPKEKQLYNMKALIIGLIVGSISGAVGLLSKFLGPTKWKPQTVGEVTVAFVMRVCLALISAIVTGYSCGDEYYSG